MEIDSSCQKESHALVWQVGVELPQSVWHLIPDRTPAAVATKTIEAKMYRSTISDNTYVVATVWIVLTIKPQIEKTPPTKPALLQPVAMQFQPL